MREFTNTEHMAGWKDSPCLVLDDSIKPSNQLNKRAYLWIKPSRLLVVDNSNLCPALLQLIWRGNPFMWKTTEIVYHGAWFGNSGRSLYCGYNGKFSPKSPLLASAQLEWCYGLYIESDCSKDIGPETKSRSAWLAKQQTFNWNVSAGLGWQSPRSSSC